MVVAPDVYKRWVRAGNLQSGRTFHTEETVVGRVMDMKFSLVYSMHRKVRVYL